MKKRIFILEKDANQICKEREWGGGVENIKKIVYCY